ncbi:unnamed protein product [Cylicocyclus nassatus]|uniref:Peptidase C1A papain C-terminal domain-containing protein n=1 Tax=Cylicocyclus nassatus TaxID=53992 RepID=A0AA36GMK9_CYLNA|nr:unnamed protein product [Cylicocyclus nassatus]
MVNIILTLLAASLATASQMSVEEFKALPVPEYVKDLKGQEFVDYINNNQPFYKAEIPKMTYEEFKSRLMAVSFLKKPEQTEKAEELVLDEEIPERFDAREKWPQCDSIKLIRDQANCGSCWAVSAASAMSDRVCMQSNGARRTMVSDTDILACCGISCGLGCYGGFVLSAWTYAKNKGVCSGGPYKATDCCKPNEFHPCGKHKDQPYYGECPDDAKTPACRARCQFRYRKDYEGDKIYASSSYWVNENETAIQKEIMANGPVQAAFRVYTDFMYYTSGVYMYKWGEEAGGHVIKIIGWGVENGVKYWLVANSWNFDWGEEGYFKILRGSNECGIEEEVAAGMIKV